MYKLLPGHGASGETLFHASDPEVQATLREWGAEYFTDGSRIKLGPHGEYLDRKTGRRVYGIGCKLEPITHLGKKMVVTLSTGFSTFGCADFIYTLRWRHGHWEIASEEMGAIS